MKTNIPAARNTEQEISADICVIGGGSGGLSVAAGASQMGAEVVLVAPPTLLPVGVGDWPVTVSQDLDAELPAADAVLMLRVQAERMNGGFFPSAREYSVLYGLSEKRRSLLAEHAVVLHPGPMLRGMEIAYSVADSSQSAVLQQVSNGVHVRMAVLFHLLVGAGADGVGVST